MFRFHLIRNLRSLLWLCLISLVPLSLGALYWINKTGIPEEWRNAIEKEISKRGVHVQVDSISYVPLRGFVADDIRFYAEAERIHELSRFERVRISLDNSQLASGEFQIRKLELRNAKYSLPVDPTKPGDEALKITQLNATILMDQQGLIEVREAKGDVNGIKLLINARLLTEKTIVTTPEDQKKREGRRRELIAQVLAQLEPWDFGTESPPHIHLDITGNLADKSTLRADFNIQAPRLEKNQYALTDLELRGSLKSYLLELKSFSANDARGRITGYADYQLEAREGRFDVESSIELPRLLKSWLDRTVATELLIGGIMRFETLGSIRFSPEMKPELSLTGHASCQSLMFRGIALDSLETSFSWQKNRLYLRDLKIRRPDGEANAKVITKGTKVFLSLHTTLPVQLFEPVFKGQPLEKIIRDFTVNNEPFAEIFIDGSLDTKDRFDWNYVGRGTLKNQSYKGTPFKHAFCHFHVNHHKLDFYDGTVTFDYRRYPLRNAFEGPVEGTAKVKRICYEAKSKTVIVEKVKGDIWAAPMVRLFAPKIADNLEVYRFHQPPSMEGNGVVDVTPQGRTKLFVSFLSTAPVDYSFLGKMLRFGSSKADVGISGNEVKISNLSLSIFGGVIQGDLVNAADSKLSGEVNWTGLAMKDLSSAYEFEMKGGGDLTGRIDFSISKGNLATMQGEGLVSLESAELLSIPIFGPLSSVVSTVLDDKELGYERAEAAFCTFDIKDGILRTYDFQSATPSVNFTGDGEVNLSNKNIDFTIRLNARGLLGLITLPLRPFYGLFQFRGTGTISESKWENVRFVAPPDQQNRRLLAPAPRANQIVE